MRFCKGKIQTFDSSKGPNRCSYTMSITSMRGKKIDFHFVCPLRGCDVIRDVTKPFFLNLQHYFRTILCLLTHQTCKEGRFSQPLWFCDWYISILIKHETCLSVCPRFSQPPKVPASWNFGSRRHLGLVRTWRSPIFEFFIFTDSRGIFRVF